VHRWLRVCLRRLASAGHRGAAGVAAAAAAAAAESRGGLMRSI